MSRGRVIYLPALGGWALVNGAYLAWYFVGRRDQRAIEAILADAYETVDR